MFSFNQISSSTIISPVASSRPATILKIVVFPEPLTPLNATNSPFCKDRFISKFITPFEP